MVIMKPFTTSKAWKKAVVKECLDDRYYPVETSDCDTFRRNRFHLKKTEEYPE